MKDSVKTENRAIEILQNWLNEQVTDENMSDQSNIVACESNCECGDTLAYAAFYEGGSKFARVTVCDCCGDDDRFVSEVLEIR